MLNLNGQLQQLVVSLGNEQIIDIAIDPGLPPIPSNGVTYISQYGNTEEAWIAALADNDVVLADINTYHTDPNKIIRINSGKKIFRTANVEHKCQAEGTKRMFEMPVNHQGQICTLNLNGAGLLSNGSGTCMYVASQHCIVSPEYMTDENNSLSTRLISLRSGWHNVVIQGDYKNSATLIDNLYEGSKLELSNFSFAGYSNRGYYARAPISGAIDDVTFKKFQIYKARNHSTQNIRQPFTHQVLGLGTEVPANWGRHTNIVMEDGLLNLGKEPFIRWDESGTIGTADSISFHHTHGLRVSRVHCHGSGENGIVATIGSKNVLIEDSVFSECDLHGIAIGRSTAPPELSTREDTKCRNIEINRCTILDCGLDAAPANPNVPNDVPGDHPGSTVFATNPTASAGGRNGIHLADCDNVYGVNNIVRSSHSINPEFNSMRFGIAGKMATNIDLDCVIEGAIDADVILHET